MKKFFSILLALCILFSSLTCLSGCSFESSDETMTKGEWVALLASEFGLDDYKTQEPAFSDVGKDNELFTSVQSCVDWGILDNTGSSKLKPNQTARIEFALATAVAVADVGTEGKSLAQFAQDEGIVGEGYLDVNGKLTQEKAEKIIEWAKDLYHNREIEEVKILEYADTVKDVTKTIKVVNSSGTTFTISGSDVSSMAKGDVIILPPSAEYPDGYARKLTSVKKNSDGTCTIETEDPAIEEILSDLDIATTVVPDVDKIICADGVSISSGSTSLNSVKAQVGTLEKVNSAPVVNTGEKGVDFNVDVNLTKGKVSVSPEWTKLFNQYIDSDGKVSSTVKLDNLFGVGENVSISGEKAYSINALVPNDAGTLFEKNSTIPDRSLFGKDPYDNTDAIEAYKAGNISLDELKNKLNLTAEQTEKNASTMTNKFKGSYEITGNLAIKNLYVQPEVKLKKVLGVPVGLEKLNVEVNYDIESSLSIKGVLNEELTICTCPIPVVGPFSIAIKFMLTVDINGELTVKTVLTNNVKMEYKDGQTKKSANQSSSAEANASVVIDAGPSIGIDIMMAGLTIVDVGLKVVLRFKTEAGVKYLTSYTSDDESITINRNTDFSLSGNLYIPIITLSIGQKKSFANTLKLSFSWTLVGEKKAKCIELFKTTKTIWTEIQEIKLREEPDDEATTSVNGTDDQSSMWVNDYLKLENYFIPLAEGESQKITIANLPEGYSTSDLIWSSENNSVASVSDGVVSGVSNGSTIISVKTSDGIFTCYCSVTIAGEIVDFTPLEDEVVYAA